MFSQGETANVTVFRVILPSPPFGQTYAPVKRQLFISWHTENILGVTIRLFKKRIYLKSSIFLCSLAV